MTEQNPHQTAINHPELGPVHPFDTDTVRFPNTEHLGDGAYVSFDGYQLWLAANHHDNRVIALEPGVLGQLVEYAKRVNEAAGMRHFPV